MSSQVSSHQQEAKDYYPFNSHNNKNWYVFYTAPRAEKVVCQELNRKGYEVFLPTVKSLRVWKNRQKKWIEQVLFPSYIFVKTVNHKIYNIISISKIMTYIHVAGKPSIVPLKDINAIKQMLSLDKDVSVQCGFSEGERVKIISGPLIGYEGILTKQKGKTRFGIQLKEINQTVFIDICTSMLE